MLVRRHPRLPFASTTFAFALSSLLVPATPERAAACSPPYPYPSLSAVGTAQAAGPFFFYLSCGENGSCGDDMTPTVARSDAPDTAVPGSMEWVDEAGAHYRLLRFVPDSPLELGTSYEARFEDAQGWGAVEFQVRAPVAGSPLDALTLEHVWDTLASGTIYSCAPEAWEEPDSCGFRGGYTWTDRLVSQEVVLINLPFQDGWLIAAGDALPSDDLLPSGYERLVLEPGKESCLSVFARNLYTGEEVQRSVCATGVEPSGEYAPRTAPDPDLDECAQAPESNGVIAEDVLEAWCQVRAETCLDDSYWRQWTTRPAPDCTSFEAHCDVEALRDAMNEEEATGGDAGPVEEPPQPASVGPADMDSDTNGANTGKSQMCSVHAPGLGGSDRWAGLVAGLGLVSVILHMRRRQRSSRG